MRGGGPAGTAARGNKNSRLRDTRPWQRFNTLMCIGHEMSCFAVERDGFGSTEMPDHGGAARGKSAEDTRAHGSERRAS